MQEWSYITLLTEIYFELRFHEFFQIKLFLIFQHVETAQKLLHPGERPPMAGLCSLVEKKREVRKQINHHLHMVLTEFSYPLEDLEIYFSLYSSKENNYVSEKVTLAVTEELQNDPKGAIFMDVGTLDQIRDVHLICHVIKRNTKTPNNEAFNTLTSSKKSLCFRRPYACAAMSISKIITKGVGNVVEFDAKLQMADDKDFHHVHEQIVKKVSGKFSPVPGNGCLKVNVRLLIGKFFPKCGKIL